MPSMWGEDPLGHGFRVFRVQGELGGKDTFIHDNMHGGHHDQLMEGLTLSGGPWGYGKLWDAGARITPTTAPSTNFRESLVDGFTGIALSMESDTGDGGTVGVSYEARTKAKDLKATCEATAPIPAAGELKIKLSAPAELTEAGEAGESGALKLKIVADGVEYPVSSVSYSVTSGELTVGYRLPVTLKASAKLSIKIPAGYFMTERDAQGGAEVSSELTCGLPQVDTVGIEASGTYPVTASSSGSAVESDLFETAGATRFLLYREAAAAAGNSGGCGLTVCTLSPDGKDCSAKTIAVPGELPTQVTGISVLTLSDGTVFARLRGEESQALDLLIDSNWVTVLASRVPTAAELAGTPTFFELGGHAASATVTDGACTVYSYTRNGSTFDAASEGLAATGGIAPDRVVDAGDGYVAAEKDMAGEPGSNSSVIMLWHRPADVAALASLEPEVRIEIPTGVHVNGVRVANGRVYAWVTDEKDGSTEGDAWANALVEYDLKGNLIKRVASSPLIALFQVADLRVSKTGAVAVCVDQSQEQGALRGCGRVLLFDAGLSEADRMTVCSSTVGAWVGNRWLAVDRYQSDGGQSNELNWYLSKTIGITAGGSSGSTDPSNPDSDNGGSPSQGSGKSEVTKTVAAVKHAAKGTKDALADTGDCALALAAAFAGVGAIVIAAGLAFARRER